MRRPLALLWFAALTACGGDDGTSPTTLDRTPASITLAPDDVVLASLGAEAQLTATVRNQAGDALSGARVTWTSSNPEVATVDSSGTVAAVDNGATTVAAVAGQVSASVPVRVQQVTDSLSVAFSPIRLNEVGDTLAFSVSAFDALGNPVRGEPVVASSDPLLLRLLDHDAVVGLRRGWADVVVTIGGVTRGFEVDIDNWVLAGKAATRPQQIGPWTISRVDGTGERVLRDLDGVLGDADVRWPTWHPSGNVLAMVSGSPDQTVVADPVSGEVTARFVFGASRTVEALEWSPTGDTLGLLLSHTFAGGEVFEFGIATGIPVGSRQRIVAADTFRAAPEGCGGSYRNQLGWDDRNRMSAVRFEPCRDDYREALVVVSPVDGSMEEIFRVGPGSIEDASWSPDHTLVGISGFDEATGATSEFAVVLRVRDLAVIGADPAATRTRGFAWKPSGDVLAHSYLDEIRIMRPDGTVLGAFPRPAQAGRILGYDWDPSGRWLVVSCLAPVNEEDYTLLWMLRPDTGESRIIRTQGANVRGFPRWRP